MIFEKYTTCNGAVQWREVKGDRRFRKVVIGLVWPGPNPGFACVVAEDAFKDARAERFSLHVLKELEDPELGGFISMLHQLAGAYQVTDLLGDPENKTAQEFLYRFNADLYRQERQGLSISRAALHGEASQVEYALRVTQQRLRSGSKSLFFGADMKLPALLVNFRPRAITSATPADYPGPVALGYAVAAFERSGISVEIPGRPAPRAITDYDPFTYYDQPANKFNRRF